MLDEDEPDTVMLVDYPGFNLLAGEAARRRGIKVVWYVLPQIWAWAPWRAKRIARAADELLAILPFERAFYAEYGIEATYVGYPLFDELDREFYQAMEAQPTEPQLPLQEQVVLARCLWYSLHSRSIRRAERRPARRRSTTASVPERVRTRAW